MEDFFVWHTRRASSYYDAYWQWVKLNHAALDDELSARRHDVFKAVYTYGWQYDMQILSAGDFCDKLRDIAREV